MAIRYCGSSWARDRSAPALPEHLVGTPAAFVWRILRAGERVPKWRQALNILRNAGR